MRFYTARRRVLPFVGLGMAALVFIVTVIRAAHTEITYDESFTYLNYVRDMSRAQLPSLFWQAQTNNHMLNTLLIWVVQVVSNTYYSEFLIRLPTIVFYGLYLGLAVWLLLKRAIPFWAYTLLVLCVHLHEFFGLARGYGMATALVLAALTLHWQWRRTGKFYYLSLSFAAFALSGTAITYVLVILLAFGLDALLRFWRKRQLWAYIKRQWLPLVPVAAVCVFVVAYQFISHRNTGFDPGGATGPLAFFDAFFLGFSGALATKSGVLATTLAGALLAFFVAGALLFRKKLLASVFVLPFLLNVVVWTLLATFGSAIPTDRGFLIFYPLMVLALAEMARWWRQWLQRWLKQPRLLRLWLPRALAGAAALCTAAAFALNVSIHTTRDWHEEYGIREALYYVYIHRLDASALAESQSNTVFFYHDQIAYYFQYDIFTGQMLEP